MSSGHWGSRNNSRVSLNCRACMMDSIALALTGLSHIRSDTRVVLLLIAMAIASHALSVILLLLTLSPFSLLFLLSAVKSLIAALEDNQVKYILSSSRSESGCNNIVYSCSSSPIPLFPLIESFLTLHLITMSLIKEDEDAVR